MRSLLAAIERFFAGWRFAACTLGLILSYEIWLLLMVCMPAGEGPFAAFAAEFRAWCFGADVATGAANVVQTLAMLTSPLLLVVVVLYVWGGSLRRAFVRERAPLLWQAGGSAATAAGLAALLMFGADVGPGGPLPFPAAALRIAVPAPAIELVDHTGAPFTMAAERGSVLLLTAVYSTCGYTCPGLMADLNDAIDALSPAEREHLRVVIPTLDPQRDTLAVLAQVAEQRGFEAPLVRMLTGEPATVEQALDRLGFERRRDPVTGVIDHPNLFLLIDRAGRIAYRLAPGEQQKPWLVEALRVLLQESPGP